MLEQLYQKREIPPLLSWTKVMAATVILIGVVSIIFTVKAGVNTPKPYISNLLLVGSGVITITVLHIKKKYFNLIHTVNCTFYMSTIIWTYIDQDFYHDPSSNFLNGYIQGLATYVYITGTKFLPKLFLITLLFVNMAFCNGLNSFLSQFLQVTPLWLIFIYKVYVDEKTNRRLFLSQQQEHVYKYIIQNVLPNGLYIVKFDKKVERIELNSSNQKPKLLSYVKNNDDMKHLMKNTILASDDAKLQNLMKSNAITWADTLEGHLRRKISQALEWGEKRFIKLKDKNVIRSKQGTSSNDSDNGQCSIINNSNINFENGRSLTKNTINNSDQDIQNNRNTQSTYNFQQQFQKKKLQESQNNQIISLKGQNGNGNLSPLNDLKNLRSKLKQYTQPSNNNLDQQEHNSMVGLKYQQTTPVQNKQNKTPVNQYSQQLISVQEVASNLLYNSQNLLSLQNQVGQPKKSIKEKLPNNNLLKSGLTQRNVAAAASQAVLDKKVTLNEENQNTITDLVEYFSAVYKKNDDTQYKLNLRLSTFYLNEIYGVISVEDESYKEKFVSKERAYFNLQEIFMRAIKDMNNLTVSHLYKLMRQQNLASQTVELEIKNNSENLYQFLKLKNKLDNYNSALQILSSRFPQKIQLNECTEFSLQKELKPFFDICLAKAKLSKIKLLFDYSPAILQNDYLFTHKQFFNHLIFNIIFNAIENTPPKGIIAVRIDLNQEKTQVKFKIFNTTVQNIDAQYLYNYHDPITITTLMNDIKHIDRPQLGLRFAHRILQKLGPSSKIEYTQKENNNLQDSFNIENICGYLESENSAYKFSPRSSVNTVFQTFYLYKDMQTVLQPNIQANMPNQSMLIQKSVVSDSTDLLKQRFILQNQLQKNTPYIAETKSNIKNEPQRNSSLQIDKLTPQQLNITQLINDNQASLGLQVINKSNSVGPINYNNSSSCMVMDESNDSFKLWIKNKQIEDCNKSIPKLYSLKQNLVNASKDQSQIQSEHFSSITTSKIKV
ncbi:transmembrane protein, putative (macronuclear) [Tetrahymena thermophila SB210]|uniref:Transmembrane protein, putative n=1 Tax=Tetrahymena thermophila (strain SB210) TaxID=312017 RepID=Q233K0_TETTS|nr:transmembrane protein, putative [Tetrahymena thermophila SB210]EAR91580.2 transmembrane protein, putative [Tetrahymena thermophila SB210]|eukprot:XP_001011825.2 transmembrane protein, putative [Tetrahymena thermophila SB210]